MPIYEYRCQACGRRSQVFFRSFSAVANARCPHCNSPDVSRLPSRVAQVRSEEGYRDMLSDPSQFADVNYEDPRAVAEWAKRMGQASGVDLGSDYDEMIEHLAQGDDLGDMGPSGGAGFGEDDLDLGDL